MFADEMKRAVRDRDRAGICRLIEAIPASRWSYPGSPPCAEAWHGSVHIVIHHCSGGTGINTYDTVSVNVRFPDGEPEWAGKYSAEELRLPNYIPPSQQRSGRAA
jgi:hypothetical protein